MISHLTDSDLVIDYLRKRDSALQLLNPLIEEQALAISLITYAEVYDGIFGSRERDQGLSGLEDFAAGVEIIGLDRRTAELFAELRSGLRARGEILPDHDLWIAATAIRHDLVLLSRDHHFDRIVSLKRSSKVSSPNQARYLNAGITSLPQSSSAFLKSAFGRRPMKLVQNRS